ncbi:MAG TPA: hypothetical protein VN840_12005 [Streptosporangiaceae bacterium]|nr:hypothetical protein [Streptosporangiaceae bacterium]
MNGVRPVVSRGSGLWPRGVALAAVMLAGVPLVIGLGGGAAPAVSTDGYPVLAARAIRLLETRYYNGSGEWHMCVPVICNTKNRDWGADSLTDTLYFRWQLTRDRGVLPIVSTLARTAHLFVPAETGTSDVAMWDAVAMVREYQVTGDPIALAKAEAAFRWVDSVKSAVYARGACPAIDYELPYGRPGDLKTLETDSNYIKAALLLYQVTHDGSYLTKAEAKYADVRQYFLDPVVPLYTAYLFDNGSSCRQLGGRYYASVNGNMIWAGAALARFTGNQGYLREAVATARAVGRYLSDGAGIFVDMQADNDVVEPLVEAMYSLAVLDHQAFARTWLLTNASAAGAGVTADGGYGRFFGGPPPLGLLTSWQLNGGITLMAAAAALDPAGAPADPGFWRRAEFVADSGQLAGAPLLITFTGRAIAIIGTLGDVCCGTGHARVFIDGRETFDRTGIWQDKTSSARHLPGEVLFAWRWKVAGPHIVEITPGIFNTMEGGSYFHMAGYYVVK